MESFCVFHQVFCIKKDPQTPREAPFFGQWSDEANRGNARWARCCGHVGFSGVWLAGAASCARSSSPLVAGHAFEQERAANTQHQGGRSAGGDYPPRCRSLSAPFRDRKESLMAQKRL
jgi:hypothetical protein